jgi:large conductance mechanosensitive channel
MFQEFREFIARGNAFDLAVGIIMGTSFGAIVSSLVNDVVMPPIGLLLGGVDFSNLFISLSGKSYPSLASAKAAGAATINIGVFMNTVLNFLIIAFVIFMLVRTINRVKRQPAPATPTTRACPHCLSMIPIRATRCAHCTSELRAA